MSVLMYIETSSWHLVFICLDVILFVFGMVVQHIFSTKNKLIIFGSSSLILLFCLLGSVFNHFDVPTRWAYFMGYTASGIALFEMGAIVYNAIRKKKKE